MKKLEEDSKRRVEEPIDTLMRNPLSGRPLKGRLRKLWRYRVGKHRIIYPPKPRHIQPILVGSRETVYKG